MTAITIDHQETIVVDTTELKRLTGDKRRRSPKKRQGGNSSDTKSVDSSVNSNNSTPRRRRKRPNGKGKGGSPKGPQLMPTLTDEQKQQYVALDCEMVGIGYKGHKSTLARVTCVGWDSEILLDEYVLPEVEVTNYRTFVSGITPELLEEKGISFDECRSKVMNLLKNKILVGHALKNDLQVLQMDHPWQLTRDTAKYEPFMKVRFVEDGILWPRKLKDLSKTKLNRDIQIEGTPHSPLEDAQAALDLYKRAYVKWEKAVAYKIAKTEAIMKKNMETPRQ